MNINWSGPLTRCWCSFPVTPFAKQFRMTFIRRYNHHLLIHRHDTAMEKFRRKYGNPDARYGKGELSS